MELAEQGPITISRLGWHLRRRALDWDGHPGSHCCLEPSKTAQHLCRSGAVDEVRRKAEELGL